ncbi:MAG: hypothetical protein PHS88_12670, partial [Candidatus Omnitrophica bacterium]|nr:hypothetical protein [Candidatus Omnitrophota bacterium]
IHTGVGQELVPLLNTAMLDAESHGLELPIEQIEIVTGGTIQDFHTAYDYQGAFGRYFSD